MSMDYNMNRNRMLAEALSGRWRDNPRRRGMLPPFREGPPPFGGGIGQSPQWRGSATQTMPEQANGGGYPGNQDAGMTTEPRRPRMSMWAQQNKPGWGGQRER